ncbi:abortive infection family protein [Thiohalomonas denitrificans]|uniref:Abortive infection C-terminus n=1 Tax=Thiohalomonas denitrificans TaxID=415747 RepID=A0A1G5R0N1_9GAMM|nr:abortive infection family protein [Thiohalomonas denitrificans]SCZ67613.1 Abortive infection C-terminus [Thiohalomonas denitrificans]
MKSVKVDQPTIRALQKVITGDPISSSGALSPYRSGPDLIDFFNQFGANEEYSQGFPSRWVYAEGKLSELNGKPKFKSVIEHCVDPRHFFGSDFPADDAADYLNQYLEFDGYKLLKNGKAYSLSPIGEGTINFEHAILENNAPNIDFIREQIYKCKSKVASGDHDGAITNARSLLEAVLLELEETMTGAATSYNGDLNQLYKRVQKHLNLEPSRKDISDSLKQILTGIISIVGGIAPLRNKMSDSHARTYRPAEHHAKLAVNSVHTICMFFLESFEYQVKSGFIKLPHNT